MLAQLIALDIDPNVVKPGWTPFIITLVLAAVMVVLYRSMRRQFGRIRDLPRDADLAARPTGMGAPADRSAPRPGPDADSTVGAERPNGPGSELRS